MYIFGENEIFRNVNLSLVRFSKERSTCFAELVHDNTWGRREDCPLLKVSRLSDDFRRKLSDDRISEKLWVTDNLPFVPVLSYSEMYTFWPMISFVSFLSVGWPNVVKATALCCMRCLYGCFPVIRPRHKSEASTALCCWHCAVVLPLPRPIVTRAAQSVVWLTASPIPFTQE